MAYIILDDIPLKIKSISRDPQPNIVNKSYVGGGSFIKNRGYKGRKLDLSVYVGKDQINQIEELEFKTTPVILTSKSKSGKYNGQYYITDIKPTENKKGIWNYSITLQEHSIPNIVWSNFENWNVSSSGGGVAGGDVTGESPLSNCPTLQIGDRGDCVWELQTFLKLYGYYVYVDGHSLTVDGVFNQYTKNSVIAFQQDNNITADGVVGPETKAKMANY